MHTDFKPAHYTSVSPYLLVPKAWNTINFLKQAFDAVELHIMQTDDGGIMHAEVKVDDSIIMLADASDEWRASPIHVHVYVRDVDVTYKRALQAGATSVQEPVKKEDADKRGGIKDVNGVIWWIATKME
jgi:uncharacterized glyoxalase superfamily protein PhnB